MKKRIEEKASITAQMTCLIRALSYYEKDPMYKSKDYVASALLDPILCFLAKSAFFRNIYKYLAPKGIYEYVIARTKYIDEVFEKIGERFEQILIFGAGLDTRSIRFKNQLKNAYIFELDSPATQTAKIERLRKKRITIPSNVVFIPIDFQKESLTQKLEEYGFKKSEEGLIILEGLTMYLDAKSVDETFKLISGLAGKGSLVIFDYVHKSVIEHKNKYHGEKELSGLVSIFGEYWSFGFEKGKIEDYLLQNGLYMVEEADAQILEKRFFTKEKVHGHVNETHSIVTARKE